MAIKKTDEIYIGLIFANDWEIKQKFTPKEYEAILKKAGIDKTGLHNSYYLCKNKKCGVETYIERTQIRRALGRNATCMHQCKNCNPKNCYYKTLFRTHANPENIDRAPKVKPGDTNGIFTVKKVIPTTVSHLPQITLECVCNKCGASKVLYMHHYENKNHTCDCFRDGSMGETLVNNYLKKKKISFEREYTFDDLSGKGNGKLRYDFALFKNKKLVGVIEFDGQQHFQEGGLFNPEGRVQEHDEIKNQYLKAHKIPLLRIPYYEADKINSLIDNFLKKVM